MRRQTALMVAFALVLASGRDAAAALPMEIEELRIQQRLGQQVSLQLTFRDEQGRMVPLRNFIAGKPVILVLAYYRCPRLCSMLIHDLVQSLSQVPLTAGEDFQVVIVSFDPQETAELAAANKKVCLEQYGRPGADAGWHFLTGEEKNIRQLADAVGFRYRLDPKTGQYQHAAGIMLLTSEGKVARYFLTLEFPPRDLRLGLVEAANGMIGTPVDNALLFTCMAFDPATGRYSLAVLKLMRTGGVITVVLLGSYLGWHWLRGRRAPIQNKVQPQNVALKKC